MLARDGKSIQLRLLVPAALCGTIIGKGGQTIRGIADDSKANITVSSQVGFCDVCKDEDSECVATVDSRH